MLLQRMTAMQRTNKGRGKCKIFLFFSYSQLTFCVRFAVWPQAPQPPAHSLSLARAMEN